MAATQFEPIGPFEILFDKGTRRIEKEHIQSFFANKEINKKIDLLKTRGCYVFALRAGKGFTP